VTCHVDLNAASLRSQIPAKCSLYPQVPNAPNLPKCRKLFLNILPLMPVSSASVEECRIQPNGTVPSTCTHDGYEFSRNLLDKCCVESKIVQEELETFFERTRTRLNLLDQCSSSIDELTKEVRNLVAFHFGNPSAKTMTNMKRAQNNWNNFEKQNFKAIQAELGTCLSLTCFVLIFPVASSGGGTVSREELNQLLRERYHQWTPDDALSTEDTLLSMDSSTSSTRSTMPLGDILFPVQSEKWKSERKRLWEGMKASVSIFCDCAC
jgi:hypothetical protein